MTCRRYSVTPSGILDLAKQVAYRTHEYSRTNFHQLIRKVVVRLMQPGMLFAGSQEKHRRLRAGAETSEVLGATQWEAPGRMSHSLCVQRVSKMGNSIDIICAMIEDVAIGDFRTQSLTGRHAPNQAFCLQPDLFHRRVSGCSQSCPQ